MLRPIIASTVLGGGVGSVLAAAVLLAQADETPSAITIDNFTFGPQMLTVKAGTTVTWANKDDIPHGIGSAKMRRALRPWKRRALPRSCRARGVGVPRRPGRMCSRAAIRSAQSNRKASRPMNKRSSAVARTLAAIALIGGFVLVQHNSMFGVLIGWAHRLAPKSWMSGFTARAEAIDGAVVATYRRR